MNAFTPNELAALDRLQRQLKETNDEYVRALIAVAVHFGRTSHDDPVGCFLLNRVDVAYDALVCSNIEAGSVLFE